MSYTYVICLPATAAGSTAMASASSKLLYYAKAVGVQTMCLFMPIMLLKTHCRPVRAQRSHIFHQKQALQSTQSSLYPNVDQSGQRDADYLVAHRAVSRKLHIAV